MEHVGLENCGGRRTTGHVGPQHLHCLELGGCLESESCGSFNEKKSAGLLRSKEEKTNSSY